MANLVYFLDLWNNVKKEVFRLGLLDEYNIDEEREFFDAYKQGKIIRSESLETFLTEIKRKHKNGIRMIWLQVVSLPLSDYLRFAIDGSYLQAQKQGVEFFMVTRDEVKELIGNVTDYWLFDNSVVLPMKYDDSGRFLGEGNPALDKEEVRKYLVVKEGLLSAAVPLTKFLKNHNIKLLSTISEN